MNPPALWPAAVFSIYVLSSAFWARPLAEALRHSGWLRFSLAALTLLSLYLFFRHYTWRPKPAIAIFCGYLLFLIPGRLQAFEEWVHVLNISVLAFLFNRVLHRPWGAALGAAVIGIGEEFLQILAPNRVFDWRDVAINGIVALLAGLLLRFGVR